KRALRRLKLNRNGAKRQRLSLQRLNPHFQAMYHMRSVIARRTFGVIHQPFGGGHHRIGIARAGKAAKGGTDGCEPTGMAIWIVDPE
ncbi:hypothetical protein ABTM47_19890, partial [Acinetobacter baumannii]